MEAQIKARFPHWKHWTKVNFVRYADDFIITATSREIIEKEIAPIVKAFLNPRGLSLSPEKTKITHITEGFDFLSQNTLKFKSGIILQQPAKKAIKGIKHKLRETVFKNLNAKPKQLIAILNSILRGWTNFHKHVVSKEIFKEIDFYLCRLLSRWCKCRHPTKSWKWIHRKYFSASEELCSFSTVEDHNNERKVKIHKIFRAGKVPIVRHIKVKASANLFDKACPELVSWEKTAYFNKRRSDLKQKAKKSKQNCIMIRYKTDINKTLLNL